MTTLSTFNDRVSDTKFFCWHPPSSWILELLWLYILMGWVYLLIMLLKLTVFEKDISSFSSRKIERYNSQRVSHQNNEISRFWGNFWFRSNFFIFFSDWRCGQCPHLPKTEFLAVVSKMAKLPQNVIFDIWWILPIFGTVTSCFSMENRLLANFPYWNPDLEMTSGKDSLNVRSNKFEICYYPGKLL